MVADVPAKWYLPLRRVNIRRNLLNKTQNAEIRATLTGLPADERYILESVLGDRLSLQQIADFLTDVELGQWTPNVHPLWGPQDPPVIKADEVQSRYSSVITKLTSKGIAEQDLVEWFGIFWG